MEAAALVPVKAFGAAKARLAPVMSPADRERLARWMATQVVHSLAPLPVYVACDDEAVAAWAEEHGASVLWGPGLGLNGAVDTGIETLTGKGADHVIVSHGDLPRPESLPNVLTADTIVLVPDRRRDGTNVIARPTALSLPAAYGAGSFDQHLAAALATGADVSVRRDPLLSIDVDTVDDCRHPSVVAAIAAVLGEAMP